MSMTQTRARPLLILALAIGAASFAAALYYQYVVGLAPCKLCITQRWALGAGLALGALALLAPRLRVWLAGGAGLAFLAEAGVAVYHSGVERKIFPGPTSCSGGGGLQPYDADRLMEALTSGPPPVRCDEIAWQLFGLSMANYNVLIALAMAVLCLMAARAAGGAARAAL